jgi:hypothetical protein
MSTTTLQYDQSANIHLHGYISVDKQRLLVQNQSLHASEPRKIRLKGNRPSIPRWHNPLDHQPRGGHVASLRGIDRGTHHRLGVTFHELPQALRTTGESVLLGRSMTANAAASSGSTTISRLSIT